MNNVIAFPVPADIRKGIFLGNVPRPPVSLEAAKAVASSVSLRPGPTETPAMFVTRIVRQYKLEGGE